VYALYAVSLTLQLFGLFEKAHVH